MERPRISILTPSFNQGAYIEQTIQSVMHQDRKDWEHIVIDGGSTDETVSILERYPHLRWTYGPDGGQADALNKGLDMADGDIVGWINSDDYYETNVFGAVVEAFDRSSALWAVGNLKRIYMKQGLVIAAKSPQVTLQRLLQDPDIVYQPCTFFRKEALEKAGRLDASLHMVMDYDLWLRLAKLGDPVMVDANWAYFRVHSGQKTARRNTRRQAREIGHVLRREGVPAVDRMRIAVRKELGVAKGFTKAALIRIGLLDARYESMPVRQ